MTNDFLVVLVDRSHGHFYHYDHAQCHVDELTTITDDVPKAVKGASWKGLADDKVVRHVDEHVHAHFKRVIDELHRQHYEHPYPIILGGPDEVVAEFKHFLSKQDADQVIATFHPDHNGDRKELAGRIHEEVIQHEKQHITTLLETIDNHRGPHDRGVVGHQMVTEALNLKQIQLMLLDPHHSFVGLVCPADGSITISSQTCPTCLGPMTKTSDLVTALKTLATAQSAEIIEVNDRDLLAKYEGLAGLRRYRD